MAATVGDSDLAVGSRVWVKAAGKLKGCIGVVRGLHPSGAIVVECAAGRATFARAGLGRV